MNVATKSRLNVSRLSSHIGAEVRDIELRQTLDASTIAAIHDAWLDHSVIIFRNQERFQEDLLWLPLFRRARQACPSARVLSWLFEAAAQYHDDFEHPRERSDHRRPAGWRDDVSSRHAARGDPA